VVNGERVLGVRG